MSAGLNLIAADLGASGGRVILGKFNGRTIDIQELNRFSNVPVSANGTLYWDILSLYRGVREGLTAAQSRMDGIDGIGIDGWGNDFALLDRNGRLLAKPVHYRDDRTLGMMEKVFERVPREQIYRQTGIQFMRFNGLYQLFSLFYNNDPITGIIGTFLLIPDLLVYFLTGSKISEFTNATTTQMFSPHSMDWAKDLLGNLGIPGDIFIPAVKPGTAVGGLTRGNACETGLSNAKVIAVAEHDTASAVAATPAEDDGFVYISSGTWSLMGVELKEPVISDLTYRYNFTNEGGACGTFRLLKNVMGLWIIQECRRCWERRGQKYTFAQLEEAASHAAPFRYFIDPDDDVFASPDDMPAGIAGFCRDTGQDPPETAGGYVRCVMESLALKYRFVFERIEKITGKTYNKIHIVGGGVKDRMLCGFTACSTGKG